MLTTPVVCCSPVQNIQNKIDAQRLQRPWSLSDRRQQLAEDEALRKHNADAKANGTPLRCVWHSLYLPEQGMFCQAPADLHLGHKREVRMTILVTLPVLAIQLYRGIIVSKARRASMPVPAANVIYSEAQLPVLYVTPCIPMPAVCTIGQPESHWPCVLQPEGMMQWH